MWLTALAIKRPVLVMMFIAALVVVGFYAFSRMPVELYPNIDIPSVTVVTVYPGAGPQEMESLVSEPIEEAVSTVSNIDTVQSVSREGMSIVLVQFKVGSDLEVAVGDVRSRLDRVKGLLPPEAEVPVVSKFEVGALPVLWLGVSGKRLLSEIFELCDTTIKDRFSAVDGVASVTAEGGSEREIQVRLEPGKLAAYGLDLGDVQEAVAGQNLNLPAGSISEGSREYSVRTVAEFTAVRQIEDVEVPLWDVTGFAVGTVRVGELGEVLDTEADREEFSRLNRRESVAITVQKRSGANTIQVVDGVREQVRLLEKELPADIEVREAVDQSAFIRDSVHDVRTHLFLGALLATLVVYLFLRTVRATVIIALSIPTSIMAAFIPIYFAGFTQNIMVLMALALSVGILVDDSIVVLENIFRHLSLGEAPEQAAYNGRSEIGFAAIAITLTDVVVFVPIAFTAGIVGQFFRQFGLTIATVTLFSLFASFTLAPMLASRWLKTADALRHQPSDNPTGESRAHQAYRRMLRWALHHRWQVVAIGFGGLFLAGAGVMARMQQEWFPRTDQGQYGVQMELPAGTRLETTDLVVKQVEERLRTIPEVENLFTRVGSSEAGFMEAGERGPHHAQVIVKLGERVSTLGRLFHRLGLPAGGRVRSDTELRLLTERMLRDIPGVEFRVIPMGMHGPGGAPVQVEVTGHDLPAIENCARSLLSKMQELPELREVDWSYKVGRPELQVRVDRERAADLGFTRAQVAGALRGALEGAVATKYREAGEEYDVRVRLELPEELQQRDLERLYLTSKQGAPIRVSDLTSVELAAGPTQIDHKEQQRLITISAYLAPRASLGQARQRLEAILKEVPAPPGCKVRLGGEFEQMQESVGNLMFSLLLAVVLVYMLMAGLFESVWHPLTIMLSLPMALVGAFAALIASGMNFSIITFIGIIMLVGLVTKNAILLVDYTNTLRSRGLGREEAVAQAGPVRLRPIAMTTLTVILGMTPVALGLGAGSEIRRPMAIVVIGGLILSTLLTLIIIPVMYTIMDDLQNLLGRAKSWLARKIGLGD